MLRREGKMRLAGADPARARTVRRHGDPHLDRPVSIQFGGDHDEAGLAHPHAGDPAAERRRDEPQHGLGVPRRRSGVLPAFRRRLLDRFAQRLDRRAGRRRLAQAARQRPAIVGLRRHGRVAGFDEYGQRLDAHAFRRAVCVQADGRRPLPDAGTSPHTIRSYRDSLVLLLRFVATAEDAADAADAAPDSARPPRKGEERTRILVVDDDPHALRYVRDTLAEADYAPVVTGDPEELPELIRTHKPRLVLLDLVLPDTDGIKLMESLRELEDLPVIFISAYDRDETIVRALDAGAADYIAKPFSPSELTARVRAALRRRAEPEPFRLGELEIHYEDRRVTVAGRPLALTMTEFEVLRVLSTNAGRAVTYDSLLRQAWGQRERGSAAPKLVRAIVKGLRSKLGDDAAKPAWVCNVRGVGYRMPRPGER